MNSTLRVLNIILLILIILMIFALGYQTGKKYDIAVDENDKYVAISYSVNEQKMRRLMSLIDNHFVNSIDTDSLVDKTIEYVMSNLDPHSVYLNPTTSTTVDQEMKGYYVGIGIQYVIYKDTIVITHVDKNSPNLDLFELGDRILTIDKKNVTGTEVEKAPEFIQGQNQSDVDIELIRNHKTQKVVAKRGNISKSSVSESYMLSQNLGYIKLDKFTENSYRDFKTALINLETKGMNALVLDLRGNPGGILKVAEQIADEFLPAKKLIVFTQDKQGKREFRYATDRGSFDNKPIYVLIDEGSASASEVIAGAIQDNDAGTIIGRRSYGKGLVQREISLGDGSKLRLTTAKYFTPSGRSIQKPYTNGIEEYNQDISERYTSGEMFSKDSIKVPDSLIFKTSKGRIVYGGGGIIPDEYIPIDTLGFGKWYYEHSHQNIFSTKVFQYLEANKETFKKIQEQHFVDYYNAKPFSLSLLKELHVNTQEIPAEEMDNFALNLKAIMARFLYGEPAYEKVWNQNDPAIKKAIEINQKK